MLLAERDWLDDEMNVDELLFFELLVLGDSLDVLRLLSDEPVEDDASVELVLELDLLLADWLLDSLDDESASVDAELLDFVLEDVVAVDCDVVETLFELSDEELEPLDSIRSKPPCPHL